MSWTAGSARHDDRAGFRRVLQDWRPASQSRASSAFAETSSAAILIDTDAVAALSPLSDLALDPDRKTRTRGSQVSGSSAGRALASSGIRIAGSPGTNKRTTNVGAIALMCCRDGQP